MLTELGRANVFRVLYRDDADGIVVGNYLADHWADKKIAILHDNTTFGKGVAEETKKHLKPSWRHRSGLPGLCPREERLWRRNR